MLNRMFSVSLIAGMVALGSPVMADDLESSLAAVGCVACHKMNAPLVGPSYKQVADKYRGQEGAAELLFGKVKNGGSGTWGPIPMAPHPHLSDEQIKPLIAGILAIE
ncbi:MAG: c-type cytochrome [Gammaproteobacteria bacterium]